MADSQRDRLESALVRQACDIKVQLFFPADGGQVRFLNSEGYDDRRRGLSFSRQVELPSSPLRVVLEDTRAR